MNWTEEEYQAYQNKLHKTISKTQEKIKQNKYKNKKAEIDGHTFDSQKEAKRYQELKLLVQAGKISNLELQPKFTLLDKFEKNGKKYMSIQYIADFIYTELPSKTIVVEDVKGIETDVFKLKHKLFEYKYPDLTLKII